MCRNWERVDDVIRVHWCSSSFSDGYKDGTMVPMTLKPVGNKEVSFTDADVAAEFEEALDSRQAAKEAIKGLEAVVEGADQKLQAILDEGQFTRVTSHGWTVSKRDGGERRTIDPAKLLALGVPAHVIEQATKVTTTKPGISVRKAVERDEFMDYVEEVQAKAKHDSQD